MNDGLKTRGAALPAGSAEVPDARRRLLTFGAGLLPVLPLMPGCGGGPTSEAGTPLLGGAAGAEGAPEFDVPPPPEPDPPSPPLPGMSPDNRAAGAPVGAVGVTWTTPCASV